MAGIYIHVPYCKQACRYCNFHFTTQLNSRNDYVNALLREIELRKNYLPAEPIETIYVGGGTPTLLPQGALQKIKHKLEQHYDLTQVKEFTVEANPDDITNDLVEELKSIGVNRLSIGIQSFFDEHLQLMNRSHSSEQALKAASIAQQNGITNLTVDLMYALPGMTMEQWLQNLETVKRLGVQHVSCYNLTLEERTALAHMVTQKQIELPDDEVAAEQFKALRAWSKANGFIHYEISNLAKPGFESKHNSNYWRGKPYIGFGPSAHSFDGKNRRWNKANTPLYIKALVEENSVPFEEEILDDAQRYNEFVMTGLRTIWGINEQTLLDKFGDTLYKNFHLEAQPLMLQDLLQFDGYNFTLTETGLYFADQIAAQLFYTDD